MGLTHRIQIQAQVAGLAINCAIEKTTDVQAAYRETVAAAKSGTLHIRTSATVGTLTLADNHGITTGNKIDIYWSGGCRRGVTVGTVATNEVPFSLGTGNDLPVAATAVTASKRTAGNLSFIFADVVILMASCEKAAVVTFIDGATEYPIALAAGEPYLIVPPLTDGALTGLTTIASILVSQSDSAAGHEVLVGVAL
jgi:hypothetical protein